MQNSLLTFNWIVLLPLGIALHWAIRLIYGARRQRSQEWVFLALSNVAWLMVLAGGLGPMLILGGGFGILLFGASIVVVISVVGRYRASQGRLLLWALATAAERELPLAEAARAFAADRTDEMGRRADRLADLLEAGTDLPAALQQSRHPLPIDVELAARLGHETGRFTGALKEVAGEAARFESPWEPHLLRLAYIEFILFFGIGVSTFMMIKVVPTYQAVFADFDTELPAMTEMVITVAAMIDRYSLLVAPLVGAMLLLLLLAMIYTIWGLRWEPPGTWFLTRRYHGALILRSLAQAVQMQSPLDRAFAYLAQWYPLPPVRRRLRRIESEIEVGGDWCGALRQSGLIVDADAAVLQAAERAGNLAWALREMSESALRRISYRTGWLLSLLFPAAILILGMCVALFAVAMMFPLVSLIQNLS